MPAGRLTEPAPDRPRQAPTPRGQRIASAYLKRILTAKVYDVARETALEPARFLSRRTSQPA